MGFRRWITFLVLLTLPLAGLGGLLRLTQGPYSFSCQTRHDGFAIVITSESSGQSNAYGIPVGGCLQL
jgi:hypothetical protein